MTVGKLLTGKDMPLTNVEMVLTNTFYLAKAKLEKAHKKGRR